MKVEKHIAAEVEPGVPVRASQTGLMAFILTYIRARGRKRPKAEVEELRESEEVRDKGGRGAQACGRSVARSSVLGVHVVPEGLLAGSGQFARCAFVTSSKQLTYYQFGWQPSCRFANVASNTKSTSAVPARYRRGR